MLGIGLKGLVGLGFGLRAGGLEGLGHESVQGSRA